jgi:hypothetical protein
MTRHPFSHDPEKLSQVRANVLDRRADPKDLKDTKDMSPQAVQSVFLLVLAVLPPGEPK